MNSPKFSIRIKPIIIAYINEYRGKKTKAQFINEAIIDKLRKEAEQNPIPGVIFLSG